MTTIRIKNKIMTFGCFVLLLIFEVLVLGYLGYQIADSTTVIIWNIFLIVIGVAEVEVVKVDIDEK